MKNDFPVTLFEVYDKVVTVRNEINYINFQPYIEEIYNHLRDEPFKKFLER